MSFLRAFLQALHARSRTPRRHSGQLYCSNRLLHPQRFRLKRVYWWAGRALCKRCYRHYTANIHVCRRHH